MPESLKDLISAISQFKVEPSPCPGIGQVFLDKQPENPRNGRFVLEGGVGPYTDYYVLMSEQSYREGGSGTRLIRHITMMEPADADAEAAFGKLIDIVEATQWLNEGSEAEASGNVGLADTKLSAALGTFREYPDRSELPVILSKLGNVRATQQRIKEARSYYSQSVDAAKRVFGTDDPFTLKSEQALAMAEINLGHTRTATDRLNRVVRVVESMYTSGNIENMSSQVLVMSYSSLGDIKLGTGDLKGALAEYQKGMDKASQLFGYGHPVTHMVAGKVQNLASYIM